MDSKTIVLAIVAVLIVTSVTVPVINEATQHTVTITEKLEDNYGRYSMVEDFRIEKIDGIPLLTSSVLYTEPENYGREAQTNFIVLENSVMARYGNSWYIFYVEDGERKQTTISDTAPIVFSDGNLAFLSHTVPCAWAFLLDPSGDWAFTTVLKDAIWTENPVYNFEYVTANSGVVEWNGKDYHVNFWMDGTSVLTDTYTPNPDNIGEIPLGNDTGYALVGSMFKWLMPYEYRYTETVQSEGAIYSIIALIPLICLMGVVVRIATYFHRRTD